MKKPVVIEWSVRGREFAELAKKMRELPPSEVFDFYSQSYSQAVWESTPVVMNFFDMFSKVSEDSQGMPMHRCEFCVSVESTMNEETRTFWAGRKFWQATYLHSRSPLGIDYVQFFIEVGPHLRVDFKHGEILSMLGSKPLETLEGGTLMKFATSKEAAEESSPMITEALKSLCPWACAE